MHAQSSGVCAHARATRPPQKSRPRKRRTTQNLTNQLPPRNSLSTHPQEPLASKSLARKKKKKEQQRAKNKEEKRVKREADDAEFEKLIAEHNELLNCDGKRDEPTENNNKNNNKNMHVRVHDVPKRAPPAMMCRVTSRRAIRHRQQLRGWRHRQPRPPPSTQRPDESVWHPCSNKKRNGNWSKPNSECDLRCRLIPHRFAVPGFLRAGSQHDMREHGFQILEPPITSHTPQKRSLRCRAMPPQSCSCRWHPSFMPKPVWQASVTC